MRFGPLLVVLFTMVAGPASAAYAARPVPACPVTEDAMQGWNTPAPPHRIFGDTYYVGSCGISSILIVGKQGDILIDGATDKAAGLIEANIRALGFTLSDVKVILNTHEHSDHAGGLAQLQRDIGAPVLVRAPAATTLRRGAADRTDPQFGVLDNYPPVANVRDIVDGQIIRVGDVALSSHATPGHAPGSTSWTWKSCEGAHCLNIAYADSLSALSDKHYRYIDHPDYVATFRHSIDIVAALPCDILLSPHPLASDLFARMDGKATLVDAGACQRYAAEARTHLDQRLQHEKDGTKP